MRRFEVIALSVGTEWGRILRLGDLISEDELQVREADELIKGGFIQEVEESKEPEVKKKKEKKGKKEKPVKKSLGKKLLESLQ